ncbi:MAG: hypothetical protein R3F55_25715 [Alphaproteobacteria bacterium]
MQPVHGDDVVAAFMAALTAPEAPGEPIVLAGPAPISYRDFARACAAAVGRRAWIVPVPVRPVAALLDGLAACGCGCRSAATLRRTAEDKAFDVGPARRRLGIEFRPFTPTGRPA